MRTRKSSPRADPTDRRAPEQSRREPEEEMTFNPHTTEDRRAMLDAIGVARLEALFGAIPESVRFPELTLPEPLSEPEVYSRLNQIASRNMQGMANPSFLGAGSYTHYIPAAVQQIV